EAQQVERSDAIAREEAVQRGRAGVARLPLIVEQQLPATARQDERSAQSSRTATDNDDVEHVRLKCKPTAMSAFNRTLEMNVSDFDFELPDELIAQRPPTTRGESRLLVVHRDDGLEHMAFEELGRYLTPGDLLV